MRSTRDQPVVWDPFVRVFHWSLLGAYVTAWATAEEWAGLHERVGYFTLALIGLRLAWGLIGSRYARFSDFVAGPGRTFAYAKSLLRGNASGAIVGIADSCGDAANGLHGGVGNRNAIGT